MNKRVLSLCLAAALLLGIFAIAPVSAYAASDMTTSEACLDVIKELEGFSATPYKDSDGKYTIGYGTRCPDELVEQYKKTPMTQEEADAELRKEMVSYETAVNAFIDRHGLSYNQGQFDGVISLVFNCGTSWLTKGNTLIAALVGDVSDNDLIYAFCVYSMSGGSRSIGHIKRRLSEANMYLNQQYARQHPDHYSYVLYNGNGGTVSSYNVQGYDAKITAEPKITATYSGYTFLGWYTKAVGGEKVTRLDESTKGMTLYAHWSKGGQSGTTDKPGSTPTGTPISPVKIKVTGSAVNIRKGPGTTYAVVDTVSKGTQLTVTATYAESKYLWGKTSAGWIRLDYTDYDDAVAPPVQEPQPEPDPEPEQGNEKVYGTVIGTDSLNIRKVPDGAVVGSLKKGTRVEILEQKTVNGRLWGRCSQGWICLRSYVKLETVTTDDQPEVDKPATVTRLYGTVIKTATLNIRAVPDGKVVGTLKLGQTVEIVERKTVSGREWGRCSQGWICLRSYVQLKSVTEDAPTGGNTDTVVTKTYATVIGTDSLNIRQTPDGAVVGSLKKGARVEILEQKTVNGRLWGRCSQGWICLRSYAKLETVTEGQSQVEKLTGTVTASVLNIRSGAGTGYTVVGKLYRDQDVEILEQKTVNGVLWGRCSQGWVSMDYVDFE